MRTLARKCQRCAEPVVDSGAADNPYRTTTCLRVLDVALQAQPTSAADESSEDRLHRAMAAGWHDRSRRLARVAALFDDVEHSDSDALLYQLDGHACGECMRLVFHEYSERLADHVYFADGYAAAMDTARREADAVSPVSLWATEALESEEAQLDTELADADAELAQLRDEHAVLAREEAQLEAELQSGREALEHRLDDDYVALLERNAEASAVQLASARLHELAAHRVHEEVFSIRQEEHFATVNGLRLGSLPNAPVEWDEINHAVGECCLLLYVCASKLNFTFKTFAPLPLSESSHMRRVSDGELLPLSGSFRTTFLSSSFNSALGALLTSTDEMAQAVSKAFGVKAPFRTTNDMIGDHKDNWYSIKRPMRDSPRWVRALLYLLGNLKWLLACVCAADAGAVVKVPLVLGAPPK